MEIIYKRKEEALKLLKEMGPLNMNNLEAQCYLVKMVKGACEVEAMCEGGGYSNGGEWAARGMYGSSYDNGRSYDGGYSGMHYVRGHYSRDEGPGYSSRSYSHSEGREELMREMERAMNETGSHADKQVLRQAMDVMKKR